MKKLLAIIILSILSGCGYQSIDLVEIKKAEEYCKDHKGLREIKEWFNQETIFKCYDGSKIEEDIYDRKFLRVEKE